MHHQPDLRNEWWMCRIAGSRSDLSGFLIKLSRLIAGGWSRCSGAGLQDDVIFFFMAWQLAAVMFWDLWELISEQREYRRCLVSVNQCHHQCFCCRAFKPRLASDKTWRSLRWSVKTCVPESVIWMMNCDHRWFLIIPTLWLDPSVLIKKGN